MAAKAKVTREKKLKKPRPESRKNREKSHLPGMEPQYNKKIHNAATTYADLRDTRMQAGDREHDAHGVLVAAMKEAGVTAYNYDGLTVTLTASEKAKVKTADQEKNGDGDE